MMEEKIIEILERHNGMTFLDITGCATELSAAFDDKLIDEYQRGFEDGISEANNNDRE